MKEQSKKPLLSSFLAMIGLVGVLFIAGMISAVTRFATNATFMIAFAIVAVVQVVFMTKNGRWKQYGFSVNSDLSNFPVIVPLFLIAVVPLLAGVDSSIGVQQIIYILIYMLIVAFVEEVLYRGVILNHLKQKSTNYAIFGSAIMFSISHLITAVGGKSISEVLFQVALAFVMGMILAITVISTGNIYICIAYHFVNNVSVSISQSFGTSDTIISYGVLVAAIIYLVFLMTTNRGVIYGDNAL